MWDQIELGFYLNVSSEYYFYLNIYRIVSVENYFHTIWFGSCGIPIVALEYNIKGGLLSFWTLPYKKGMLFFSSVKVVK